MLLQMLRTTGIAVAGLAVFTSLAGAQEIEADAPDSKPDVQAVDEVVVTAMKREAAIQDIGAAVTAIGGDDVKLKNIDTGEDLQFHVPNMVFSQIGGTAQYTIRGVGLGVDSGLAEPGVAVHIDGVFIPRATQTLILTGDIQRLEVLRGPQGTLYGRNATGGVINFITNPPEEEFGVGLSVGAAEFGEYTANGYVTGSVLDDAVQLRLFGDYKQRDGDVINTDLNREQGDVERYNTRLTGRVNVSDDLHVDLTLRASHLKTDIAAGQVVKDPTRVWTDLGVLTTTEFETKANDSGPTEQDVKGASITITYRGNSFNIRTITSWIKEDFTRTTDFDGGSLALFQSRNEQESEAWSQEINISGDALNNRLQWITGLFGYSEEARLASRNRGGQALDDLDASLGLPISINDILDGVRDRSIQAQNLEKNKSLGAFADLTFDVLDGLRVVGGVRLSWDRKSSDASFQNATGSCRATHTLTSQAISPKLAVEWDATDDIMAYVQYQQGIKPGGVGIGNADCNNVFQPEEIASYEAGVKTNWWDDRITANLTGFSYFYDNYQSFQIVGMAALVENAPEARVEGVEFEFTAKPLPFLAMNLNATWMDARFEEFSSVDPMATGIGVALLGISRDPQDLSGKQMVRSPEYTLSGGLQVMFPLPFVPLFDGGLARVDAYWTDDITTRPYGEPFDLRASYTMVNATVGFFSEDQNVRLRAYVKNVTDEVYVSSQFMVPLTAVALGAYGAPRTFGAVLNVSF